MELVCYELRKPRHIPPMQRLRQSKAHKTIVTRAFSDIGVDACVCRWWGKLRKVQATLAQLVERLIRNQQVAGSIPAGGSSFNTKKRLALVALAQLLV
jgi:hypothetical protein